MSVNAAFADCAGGRGSPPALPRFPGLWLVAVRKSLATMAQRRSLRTGQSEHARLPRAEDGSADGDRERAVDGKMAVLGLHGCFRLPLAIVPARPRPRFPLRGPQLGGGRPCHSF